MGRYLLFFVTALVVVAAVLCIMHGISASLDQLNTHLTGGIK